MTDIAPCPFCASCDGPMLVLYKDGNTPPKKSHLVKCDNCGSRYPKLSPDEIEAKERWNVWPRYRRTVTREQIATERKNLDERIHNQRVRLRELEREVYRKFFTDEAARRSNAPLIDEIYRLRARLEEASALKIENKRLKREHETADAALQLTGIGINMQQVYIQTAKEMGKKAREQQLRAEEAERRLEEAKKVIEPFASVHTVVTFEHIRAAKKWMEGGK